VGAPRLSVESHVASALGGMLELCRVEQG
jgi:hypothetical protein